MSTKYYYFKYRDRETKKVHKGYYSESEVDKEMNKFSPDGYLRNEISSLIGPFDLSYVKEQIKKSKYRIRKVE